MANLKDIEDHFIHAAGEIAESVSINRIVGQLYALLYIRPEPVPLDELAERLKISKGSASINIRVLEEWNAVKRSWVQGSRKDYYTADPDIFKIISQRFEHGLARRIHLSRTKVEELYAKLEEKNGKGANGKSAFYRERLKKLEELQGLCETLLKLLPKIKSLKHIKGLASFL